MRDASERPPPTPTDSLKEYARGIAGGLLFSLPLLFTMEIWWTGFIAHPWALVAYCVVTFCLLLGYNRFLGIHADASWIEVVIDSFEELGIGLVLSAGILLALGRIALDMPLTEIVGKIVVEAMTVAIGVSVGTAQLGGESGPEAEEEEDEKPTDDPSFLGQVVMSVCGAVLIALNVAPTDEIIVLAMELSSWRLLVLVAIALLLGLMILFFSDFSGSQRWVRSRGPLNSLVGMTVTYAVALVVSALSLWFFGRFDQTHLSVALGATVVLAVPATLGASAGRLLLQ